MFVSLHKEVVAMVNVTCKSCNIVELKKKLCHIPSSVPPWSFTTLLLGFKVKRVQILALFLKE
jgi:hypothetical protein